MNNLKPAFKVGMTAIEVIVEIIRVNPEIQKLSFYIYAPKYNIKELHKSKRENPLIPQLLIHDSSKATIRRDRDKITVENLTEFIHELQEDLVIGVLSKIKIKRKTYHIPMMDFAHPNSFKNAQDIEWLMQEIGQKEGVILSSGRSFHYYGVNLMNEAEWSNFLGNCLLSELVESRYIAHRYKDQCGILRLSACPLRPKTPIVILTL
ncbi:MAG: hypothetical protein ABH800_01655 [Candidatus Nealsonbacteria bacterium]